jgi:hypothetical protein
VFGGVVKDHIDLRHNGDELLKHIFFCSFLKRNFFTYATVAFGELYTPLVTTTLQTLGVNERLKIKTFCLACDCCSDILR